MLCICIDAFKFDYLEHTPYLRSLTRECLWGPLKTVLGFTGISASFFSGVYPNKHGVFGMFQRSRDGHLWSLPLPVAGNLVAAAANNLVRHLRGQRFYFKLYRIPRQLQPYLDVSMQRHWCQRGCLTYPTLFDVLEEHGRSFAVIDWPVRFVNRRGSFILASPSDATVLREYRRVRADFCFVHFGELDGIAHRFGTRSDEVASYLRQLDRRLQELDQPEMMVWSDHGMVDVVGVVDVIGALHGFDLTPRRDLVYFLDSTAARFWVGDPSIRAAIAEALARLEHGHVLSDTERDSFKLPDDVGDIVFLADPGHLILPNFFQGSRPERAMHGYAPDYPDQQGLYMFRGLSGSRTAEMVDMLPTLLTLMKLPPLPGDGVSLVDEA